jgi:hypothetical protein
VPQNVTVEQIAQALQILGVGKTVEADGVKPHEKKGFVNITESDRRWIPKSVIKLARQACPEWSRDDFSVRRWLTSAMEASRKIREANPETALAFLLRKGIQTLANDWYNSVPREWQDYALVASSDAVAEWYGPLYGSTVAGRIARGDRYPEGKIIGEDSVLVNYKFGLIESFDRELFDDDQTGQIRQRAQRLGQGMAITENAYAAIRFVGDAGSYANLVVPASNFTTVDINGNTVSGPWSATLYQSGAGAYGNRPANYGAMSLTLLKQGWADMLNAKDPLGNKIIVNPNTLWHSSKDALHAPMLVSPPAGVPYYPAPIGLSGQTASTAASGNVGGGVFGANPFMGLGIKPVLARFAADWAWALMERARGFVFQERNPLEVIQEATTSGAAFEVDAYRFRSRRRFEADWIGGGSRFAWLGNSGAVSGSF